MTVSAQCSGGAPGSAAAIVTCGGLTQTLLGEQRDQLVTVTATDAAGNMTSRTVVINIDKTAPRFVTPPTDRTIGGTGATGGRVPVLEATDNFDPDPVVACTSAIGAPLPLGPTRITCTATDAAGDDALYGDDGDDTLDSGAGTDYIDGGADNDTLLGGAGDDWLEDRQGVSQTFDGGGGDLNRCFGVSTAPPGGTVANCQVQAR